MEKLQNKSAATKKIPGRPREKTDWTGEILSERADRYFKKCDDRIKVVVTKEGIANVPDPAPYTIEGLCSYLRIDRSTFRAWRKKTDLLGEAAELIHQRISANRIEGALDGRQHAGFAQFILKNTDPEYYRDKIEVENSVAEETANMLAEWSKQWKIQR